MTEPRSAGSDWRDHLGGTIALLSLGVLSGAAALAWRASRRAEDEIDARTKARLQPHGTPAAHARAS